MVSVSTIIRTCGSTSYRCEKCASLVFAFFFISLLWLLRIMDRPFHVEERTDDDVSLFLLRSFVDRLNGSAT